VSDPVPGNAHPNCADGHTCFRPSGRVCIEVDCDEAAGTRWGPLWCPEHDKQRLDRVSASLAAITESFR